MDPLAQFKAAQRQAWASFIPFELTTCATAPRLVAFAGIQAGRRVLDVGCGTGVVAITAQRRGANVRASSGTRVTLRTFPSLTVLSTLCSASSAICSRHAPRLPRVRC